MSYGFNTEILYEMRRMGERRGKLKSRWTPMEKR